MPENGARLAALPGSRRTEPADLPARAEPAGWERSARLSRLQVLRAVDSSPRGLTEAQAEARLALHGENIVLPRREPPVARRVLNALRDPFTVLLACLALVCAVIGSLGSSAILGSLVLAAGLLRFLGERRSVLAMRALRELLPGTATVLRRAELQDLPLAREIPTDQLVPGDMVRLTCGDAVPADLRLLRSEGLVIDQSALTGESEPVGRLAPDAPSAAAPGGPFDEPHLCFTGSRVVAGSATAVVLATGEATCFGAAHLWAPEVGAGRSAVERGVRRAVWALIAFMLAAVPLTVGADTLLHGWSAGLLPFAVAAAVGLTPELLPLVLSTVLARGSQRLAGGNLLVRRLPAVSELGAMDVLCVDKTGTLTTATLAVAVSLDPADHPDPLALRWAAIAADAALDQADPSAFDPADEALLDAAELSGLLDGPAPAVLDTIAFDASRRCASVLLREAGRHVLVLKGAPEAVLARCTEVRTGPGATRPLDADRRAALEQLVARRAGEGLRLLAVARGELAPRLGGYGPADEHELTLLGFVGLQDEPVDSAADAMALLTSAGVAVKVVTGDHPRTAVRLCGRLGLAPGPVLLGSDLDALAAREVAEGTVGLLAQAVRGASVLARCTPEQKARAVQALRQDGRTVGFLGDGVNDIAALRAADVGISAGTAVGAAREWADVVLREGDLTSLGRALTIGRSAVANVAAYLRIALSCNLGNAVSMLAGGVLLPFLPMLPVQVLVQNLCFDAAQLSFAVSSRDARAGSSPVRLRWGSLALFAVLFGLLNSAGDIVMFEAMNRVTRGFSVPDAAGMFHTAWFGENLVTQALALPLLYGLGSAGIRPPRTVWAAAGALAVGGLLLPATWLGEWLGFESLPSAAYGAMVGVAAGYGGLLWAGRLCWQRCAGQT
ncbi:Mg2+-importing ATPase [Kitasatospora sp. MAP12-15]|uniref:HAD-IC family P-type ATPase n=1 Tax=unclassified Kitasatospora TaxID=2633591 RepID=UPI0024746852|nr:HAD-IC family P-type ATPase [Kitasatospora sp. MAP12-44]MDH6110414.1 Mg2+-importing ATPase [Kitasatospora sp. MAP12-44]